MNETTRTGRTEDGTSVKQHCRLQLVVVVVVVVFFFLFSPPQLFKLKIRMRLKFKVLFFTPQKPQ